MPRAEYASRMREKHVPEEQVTAWERDMRGDHTLQLQLECVGHQRTLWISFGTLESHRGVDKETSRSLASNWQDVLATSIDDGKTFGENMAESSSRKSTA